MHDFSAIESRRLLNPRALVPMALLAALPLVLVFHSEQVFLPHGARGDRVSLGYGELLLQADPDNQALRLELVESALELGEFERARRHLMRLRVSREQLAFHRVELELLQTLAAEPAPPQRLAALAEQLRQLPREPLPAGLLARLARHALALDAPSLAAQAYTELARREPARSRHWLGEAARWHLASGQPQQAAQIQLRLARRSGAALQRQTHLRLAFDALLAADRPHAAAELLVAELPQLRDTPAHLAWLAAGVDRAVAANHFDLAQRIITRWRQLAPGAAALQRVDFNLQLATGNIEAAWRIGRVLDRDQRYAERDQGQLLRQLAQLGEWSQQPRQALHYWLRLVQLRDDAGEREHAWRLALQLFDFDNGIALLSPLGQRRRLGDSELDALVHAFEARGVPLQAERWLRRYLQREPNHRRAWHHLAQNLANTHQHMAEAAVRGQIVDRFDAGAEERRQWAEALWSAYRPQAAWQVLAAAGGDVRNAGYWRLRGALASHLEREADMQLAYERLLALGVPLIRHERDLLIERYRLIAPDRALALLVEGWRRGTRRDLVAALPLAQQQRKWTLLRQLLSEAEQLPAAEQEVAIWLARAALARRDGNHELADQLYRQALHHFPGEPQLRQQLLWLHIDSGQRDPLPALLRRWHHAARSDSSLWLPFAAASQLLGRDAQALAWYRRHLQDRPHDWLVQAAYADALEAAGYRDTALRLRRQLLATAAAQPPIATPQAFATWLRLLASTSPQRALREAARWRDGSPALRQIWFERLLAGLDPQGRQQLLTECLAWAKSNGLTMPPDLVAGTAVQTRDRAALQRLLREPVTNRIHQVAALDALGHYGDALDTALDGLGDEMPDTERALLRHYALQAQRERPRGFQLGWAARDFGDVTRRGPWLRIAHPLGDHWHVDGQLDQGIFDGTALDRDALGDERHLRLALRRQGVQGGQRLIADHSDYADDDRSGLSLQQSWRLGGSGELVLDLDWHMPSEQSGLMAALGREDALTIGGVHSFSARDRFSWSLATRRFATRSGADLGSGNGFRLALGHDLRFAGPAWQLRGGIEYQRNRLDSVDLSELLIAQGGPLRLSGAPAADDLLQARYGQFWLGSEWRSGAPGELGPAAGDISWQLGVTSGWQWTDSRINYGLSAALGMRLLGDDELTLSATYQSAPPGGEGDAGGALGLSYSRRFGR